MKKQTSSFLKLSVTYRSFKGIENLKAKLKQRTSYEHVTNITDHVFVKDESYTVYHLELVKSKCVPHLFVQQAELGCYTRI